MRVREAGGLCPFSTSGRPLCPPPSDLGRIFPPQPCRSLRFKMTDDGAISLGGSAAILALALARAMYSCVYLCVLIVLV